MEYKIIVVQGHEIGKLEKMLNDLAEQGFHAVHFFESANRLIGILERNNSDPTPIGSTGEPTNFVMGEPVKIKRVGWPKGKPRKKVSETSTVTPTE